MSPTPNEPSARFRITAFPPPISASPPDGLRNRREAGRVRSGFTRVTDTGGVRQGEPEVTYEAQPGTLPPAALADTAAPVTSVDTSQNVAVVGKEGLTTTTPQDAAAGAAVGSGVGLVAGLLAAAAALMIPGVGLVLAGGALASALGAAAATTVAGAAVGGVTGYLRDMGMPEQAAASVHDRLTEGDYLVTIAVDPSRYDQIKQLLLKYNAAGVDVNVNSAGEQITNVWGNDPVIAEQIRRVSPPVPVASTGLNGRPVGETPDETAAREEAITEERARTNEAENTRRDYIGKRFCGYNKGMISPFAALHAVLFDLDGTLIETHIDFAAMSRAMQHLARQVDVPQNVTDGKDILSLVQAAAENVQERGGDGAALRREAFTQLEAMEIAGCSQPEILLGTWELLTDLTRRGIKICIVTRNCRRVSEPLLVKFSLPHDLLLTRDDVLRTKPHPEHLWEALKRVDVLPEQSAMVGDHWMDIQAGQNAGCAATLGILGRHDADWFAPCPPTTLVCDPAAALPLFAEVK